VGSRHRPGRQHHRVRGEFGQLPNGWILTPVGKHVTLTDLPLNIIPLGDGKESRGFPRDLFFDVTKLYQPGSQRHASQRIHQSGKPIRRLRVKIWLLGGNNQNPKVEIVWGGQKSIFIARSRSIAT
jgi:hypothetical protein